MNHIYKQSKGICTSYSLANAYEKLKGKVMSEAAIWELFKAAGGSDDPKARKGAVTYPQILETARLAHLVGGYEKVYFNPAITMRKSPAKMKELAEGKAKIKEALADKNKAVVVGLFAKNLKLDKKGYPKAGDIAGYHAVHLYGLGHDKREQIYIAENSWGINWGLDGMFKMSESDFDRMVREAYIITT